MKAAIIILVIIIYFIAGCFLMVRVDDFINRNSVRKKPENRIKDPSCIILSGDQSEEDIMNKVRDFRDKHSETRILIYDTETGSPQNSLFEETNDM